MLAHHRPSPAPAGLPTLRTIAIGIVVRLADAPREGLHILISRRLEDTVLAGYWEFPGGKVERDETVEEALRRELREELAIDIEPARPLTPVEHLYAHGGVRLVPYLCTLAQHSAPPRALQVAEWRWVTPDALTDYRFPEANASLVAEVQRAVRADAAS